MIGRGSSALQNNTERVSRFVKITKVADKTAAQNKNGVIRRFFPKKTNFDIITDNDIQQVEDKINNRPMKCLNFKTPAEVFISLVALTG